MGSADVVTVETLAADAALESLGAQSKAIGTVKTNKEHSSKQIGCTIKSHRKLVSPTSSDCFGVHWSWTTPFSFGAAVIVVV